MCRRSAADVSIVAFYPRLAPWARDLPPLRGYHNEEAISCEAANAQSLALAMIAERLSPVAQRKIFLSFQTFDSSATESL